MSPDEWARWIRWEFGLAAAALVLGAVAWLGLDADPRWMSLSLAIVLVGEVMRDQVIITRGRRDKRRGP